MVLDSASLLQNQYCQLVLVYIVLREVFKLFLELFLVFRMIFFYIIELIIITIICHCDYCFNFYIRFDLLCGSEIAF